MSRPRLVGLLALVVALAVPGVAAAKDYKLEAQQWSVSAAALKTGTSYKFRNLANNSQLGYGKRTWGVDLDWTTSGGDWQFMPDSGNPNIRDHRARPFGADEAVAIYNTKSRKFLFSESRNFGINLGWSSAPRYQWKADRNSSGEVSLYNTQARDHVVYGQRPYGINLRWLKDVKRDAQANGVGSLHDATVTMTAQPVVQGYLPFLGYYGGGGTKAVLTKVTNAQSNAQINFVKPGYSTTQCGQSGATVPLGPSQTMTADQMKAAFGTSAPSLANRVPFLACVAGTTASSVFVNVQYRTTG
jgi:hypothetical protein